MARMDGKWFGMTRKGIPKHKTNIHYRWQRYRKQPPIVVPSVEKKRKPYVYDPKKETNNLLRISKNFEKAWFAKNPGKTKEDMLLACLDMADRVVNLRSNDPDFRMIKDLNKLDPSMPEHSDASVEFYDKIVAFSLPDRYTCYDTDELQKLRFEKIVLGD